MPSKFHQIPSMKNPWNKTDLDRLIWKTIDLVIDAATSLRPIKGLMALDVFGAKSLLREQREQSVPEKD